MLIYYLVLYILYYVDLCTPGNGSSIIIEVRWLVYTDFDSGWNMSVIISYIFHRQVLWFSLPVYIYAYMYALYCGIAFYFNMWCCYCMLLYFEKSEIFWYNLFVLRISSENLVCLWSKTEQVWTCVHVVLYVFENKI